MKFAKKYKQLPVGEVCDDILRAKTFCKCITCGKMTEFVDINSEARVCSEECQDTFYNELNRMMNFQWDEDMWWEDASVY